MTMFVCNFTSTFEFWAEWLFEQVEKRSINQKINWNDQIQWWNNITMTRERHTLPVEALYHFHSWSSEGCRVKTACIWCLIRTVYSVQSWLFLNSFTKHYHNTIDIVSNFYDTSLFWTTLQENGNCH